MIKDYAQIARMAYEKEGIKAVTAKGLKDVEDLVKKTKNYYRSQVNDLTIIIPVYNAADKLQECIKSICRHTELSDKVKIISNR